MPRSDLPDPQPHPLRPGQRVGLAAARLALNALMPVQRLRAARADFAARTAHRYGRRHAETLEILEPEPGHAAGPAVVYIHGGGWILGRKELYTRDLAFLAEAGYRVFNLDYPLAPEHPFPVAIRSLMEALEWITVHSPETEGVHLMGDSAGGNLAVMLGLLSADPKLFEAIDPGLADRARPRVLSVVSLYGVLDRLSWIEHGFPGARTMLASYGGAGAFETEVGPEGRLAPLDFAVATRPPCLLAIGDDDPLAESSRMAHDAWASGHEPIRLIEYPGEQHGFFNMSWRDAATDLRADILDFLEEV